MTLSFKDTQQTTDNNFSYQVNTPFRTTSCKEFYDKIGNIESNYNGWVLPKFFYKDKNNKDALISINQELSMTKKVGFSDESDLGKIAIVGQDTFKFLKSIKCFLKNFSLLVLLIFLNAKKIVLRICINQRSVF